MICCMVCEYASLRAGVWVCNCAFGEFNSNLKFDFDYSILNFEFNTNLKISKFN